MKALFNMFVKITAWIPQKLVFRTKIFYENKAAQSRKLKGPAILISNHTSVYDYAAFLFVFPRRTLRYQMAEILFRKKRLGWFLKAMGGIKVDRNAFDFGFLDESKAILGKGGVVGVFPESRLPREGEERPLPFKPSAAYLALASGVPVIPLYTNGAYFCRKRAKVVIGRPLFARDLYDPQRDEKANLVFISEQFRSKIMELGTLIDGT